MASYRRRRNGRSAPGPEREGGDVLRVRQRPRQLAVPAGLQRVHLVFAARQLGPALPLRCDHRTAEESDHHRGGERHPDAAGRRKGPRDLLPRSRQGERPGPLLPSLLPGELRRLEPEAVDARRRRPYGGAVAVRSSTSSTPTRSQTLRRSRSCATAPGSSSSRSSRPTSRGSSPQAGSRRCRSR